MTSNLMKPGEVWDESIKGLGEVWSAAGRPSNDPFIKYPLWIQAHAPLCGNLLDLGCGYGRVAIPLLKSRPDLTVFGLDASADMLNYAETLKVEHGVADRFQLQQTEFPPIPLADYSVDAVITSAVLPHNSYGNAVKIIREIHRVLKPGGIAMFSSSFVARWNLEGIQSHMLQIFVPKLREKNGPVRTYTRPMVRAAMKDFASTEIFVEEVSVLPRKIYKWAYPGQQLIRKLNSVVSRYKLGRLLFPRIYLVKAIK